MKNVIDAVNELKGNLGLTYMPDACDDDKYLFFQEGKIGYILDNVKDDEGGKYQYICTVDEFNKCCDELSTNFWTSENYEQYKANYKESNKMSTVKEEFEFCDNSGTHTISSKNILCCADTGRVVAVFYNERDLMAATGLTKKVELIDGKAYQFDYSNGCTGMQAAVMRYQKSGDYFFFDNVIFKREHCKNIQLLEVKV